MTSNKVIPPKVDYESNTYLTINSLSSTRINDLNNSIAFENNNNNNSINELNPSSQRSTSSSSNSTLNSTTSSNSIISSLTYLGHVGELPNDYLYSIPIPSNQPSELVNEVKTWLKNQDGISQVEIMIPKLKKKVGRNSNWEEEEPTSSI